MEEAIETQDEAKRLFESRDAKTIEQGREQGQLGYPGGQVGRRRQSETAEVGIVCDCGLSN